MYIFIFKLIYYMLYLVVHLSFMSSKSFISFMSFMSFMCLITPFAGTLTSFMAALRRATALAQQRKSSSETRRSVLELFGGLRRSSEVPRWKWNIYIYIYIYIYRYWTSGNGYIYMYQNCIKKRKKKYIKNI